MLEFIGNIIVAFLRIIDWFWKFTGTNFGMNITVIVILVLCAVIGFIAVMKGDTNEQ